MGWRVGGCKYDGLSPSVYDESFQLLFGGNRNRPLAMQDGWVQAWMHGWMEWMHGWMGTCVFACMVGGGLGGVGHMVAPSSWAA